MAQPILLQDNFSGGEKQDFPIDKMPPNSLWYAQDVLPTRHGSATRGSERSSIETRGGWAYETAAHTGKTDIVALKQVFTSESAKIYTVVGDGTLYEDASSVGATATNEPSLHPPVDFLDEIVVFGDDDWVTGPYRSEGGSVTNMGVTDGAPLAAIGGAAWKQRLWLAGDGFGKGSGTPQRVWWSGEADITSWDLSESWVDLDDHVLWGLEGLRGTLLAFHRDRTTRIRGTPPDLLVENAFGFAPLAPNARTKLSDDIVAIASGEGLYLTDGAATTDFTKQSGMLTYWRELMDTVLSSGSAVDVPMAFAQGWLFINPRWGANNEPWLINIDEGSWWRLTNCDFSAAAASSAQGTSTDSLGDVIWGGQSGSAPRVVRLFPDVFTGSLGDADGTNPTPLIETRFYKGRSMGQQTFKSAYFTHNLGGATDITVTHKTNQRQPHTDYATGSLTASAAADELERQRLRFSKRDRMSDGIGFRLTKAASAGSFALHGIEADVHPREGSRV